MTGCPSAEYQKTNLCKTKCEHICEHSLMVSEYHNLCLNIKGTWYISITIGLAWRVNVLVFIFYSHFIYSSVLHYPIH